MFKEEMLTVTESVFLDEKWAEMVGTDTDDRLYSVYLVLKNLYTDSRREYHNLKHIHDCLKHFDMFSGSGHNIENKKNIQLAIWFHDCIYNFTPGHDEIMSQKLFVSLMSGLVNNLSGV